MILPPTLPFCPLCPRNPSNISQRSVPISPYLYGTEVPVMRLQLPMILLTSPPVISGMVQITQGRVPLYGIRGWGYMLMVIKLGRPPIISLLSKGGHTTKTSPKPFSIVHLTLYPSLSNPSCSFTPLPSMNASFTNTLIGEAGVTVRAEKEGVNDLDHRISPPRSQPSYARRY